MRCEFTQRTAGELWRCRGCGRLWLGGTTSKERLCSGAAVAPHGDRSPRRVRHRDGCVRIGLLLPWWCLGGVERYHLALAKWTSPRMHWTGCAVVSTAPTLTASVVELALWMPVHADRNLNPLGVNATAGLTRHATEQQALDAVLQDCDVLLTWGVPALKARLAQFDGTVVAISHGPGPWTENILSHSISRATAYVAVSAAAATAFPASLQPRVALLPAGVELDRIAPSLPRDEIRRELGLQPTDKAVGYIGRFSAEKNPLQAARIVGVLGEGHVAVYHGTHLWGDAEFRAEATRLSGDRVRFVGPDGHTGDIYAALDCLVQASPCEGGPLVAIEAWLTGLPLVTTPVGVIADELARGHRWGHVLPVSATLEDWRVAVVAACADETRAAAQAIRRAAVERYSAAALARRWEAFLTGL